jgi:hypothetical protein
VIVAAVGNGVRVRRAGVGGGTSGRRSFAKQRGDLIIA